MSYRRTNSHRRNFNLTESESKVEKVKDRLVGIRSMNWKDTVPEE